MSDNIIRSLMDLTDMRHRELERIIESLGQSLNQSIATGFNRVDAALDRNASQISNLAVQIGNQAQSLDRLERSIQRLTDAIDSQRQSIDGHLRVAEQQSANISELTKLLTVVLGRLAA